MATSTYVRNLLPFALEPVARAFDYALGTLRIGRAHPGETMQTRGANLQWAALSVTTPAATNTEFSIAHGLETTPYVLIPVLPLDRAGGQLVPLTATRAADAKFVFLSSPVAGAVVTVFVEG